MTTPFHPARSAHALGRPSGPARRGPRPADCSVAVHWADSCAIAAIRGDLDEGGSTRLRTDLTAAAARGHWRLVVDLSEVTSLDAAGLGVLAAADRCTRAYGGQLTLAAPSPPASRALRTHRLDQRVAVHPTVQAAIRALSDPP